VGYRSFRFQFVAVFSYSTWQQQKFRPFLFRSLRFGSVQKYALSLKNYIESIAITTTRFDSKTLLTKRKNIFCSFAGFGLISLTWVQTCMLFLHLHWSAIPGSQARSSYIACTVNLSKQIIVTSCLRRIKVTMFWNSEIFGPLQLWLQNNQP